MTQATVKGFDLHAKGLGEQVSENMSTATALTKAYGIGRTEVETPRYDAKRVRAKVARAFTLIELMVVILILAILAALIVPRVVGRTADAKIAAAKSDLATLKGALQQFRLDCDRFPTSEEGLNALETAPAGLEGKWKNPYLDKAIPKDPWGNDYVYIYPAQGGTKDSFAVESYGSDGVQGGDGDAADIVDGAQ